MISSSAIFKERLARMDVAVTGSTGLIGNALLEALQHAGHKVRRMVRTPTTDPNQVYWNPAANEINAEALRGVEAVINLAGEGIQTKRWSTEQKRRIRDSRVNGTTLLGTTLAKLDPLPRVLLNGSAIGFYGDRGNEELDETKPAGDGFLAEVTRDWEHATQPAADAGIRVVHLRTGVVLSPDGGALAKQLPLFRLGLGGRVGNGRQWFSWISLTDEIGAILHLLDSDISGPINLTAPEPVTNGDFAHRLGQALHRPAILPIPPFAPKLILGSELVESLLMSSAKVLPEKLVSSGYAFKHPTLEIAFADLLS